MLQTNPSLAPLRQCVIHALQDSTCLAFPGNASHVIKAVALLAAPLALSCLGACSSRCEGWVQSAGECSIPYARRLQSVGNPKWVPSDPSWYSFDHGNIHIIGYSTEIDFSPVSDQYK